MKLPILIVVCLAMTGAIFAAGPVSKSAAPSMPSVKKPVYALPKTGVNISPGSAGWLNIEAIGTRLVVKFFDPKKNPMSPDVERGFAQFRYSSRNPKGAPLNREGDTLVTPAKKLKPPHNFLVILSLFVGENAEPTETHTVKYP